MNRKLIVLAVCLLGVLTSCVKADKVSFSGITSVVPKNVGFTGLGIDLGVGIENTSGHTLAVVAFDVTMSKGDTPVLGIKLKEKTRVPRHFAGDVVFPLQIAFKQGLNTVRLLQELERTDFSDALVSGEVILRGGWGRKKVTIPPTSTAQFVEMYGLDLDNLMDF